MRTRVTGGSGPRKVGFCESSLVDGGVTMMTETVIYFGCASGSMVCGGIFSESSTQRKLGVWPICDMLLCHVSLVCALAVGHPCCGDPRTNVDFASPLELSVPRFPCSPRVSCVCGICMILHASWRCQLSVEQTKKLTQTPSSSPSSRSSLS